MKPYCTQNDGDCASCSLSSYGRDCQNIRIITAHKGGRTEQIPTRATKKDKAKFKEFGISGGDLFAWAVANYPKEGIRSDLFAWAVANYLKEGIRS